MNRKKMIVPVTAAAATLTLLVVISAFGFEKKEDAPDKAENASAEKVFSVMTSTVEPRDLRAYIKLNGLIDAENTVEVYPEIGGKYTNPRVQLGMKVNKGDIIAYVDPSKPGSTYSLNAIRAPISGTVTSLTGRPGSTVSTETVVATIGDIEHLRIHLKIPEREIGNMREGLAATVSVEAYPDAVFPASVYSISPLVDPVSHTKDIYLRFDRGDPRINSGMFASVELYTRLYSRCIAVPDDSILSINDKTFVFVMETNGSVSRREIERGVSIDGFTIVEQGLNRGERIVVQGAGMLSDGVKVHDIAMPAENAADKDNNE